MINFRLLLIRLKVHVLLWPFRKLFLKLGNFISLSSWINAQKNLAFNDYYSAGARYADRYRMYRFIVEHEIKDSAINYFEFGVADGETTMWWSETLKDPGTRFFGFDTFEGLPEKWGTHEKGAFSNDGKLPQIDDSRVKFFKGLFQKTLPGFLKNFSSDKKNIILLDADLYSSTLFVLTSLAPFLKKDDVIMFDEFLAPMHEFLAYQNFCEAFSHIKLVPFAAANNFSFVAFKVTAA